MRKFLHVMMWASLCLLVWSGGPARANEGIAAAWQMDYADSACSMLLDAARDCYLCHTTPPAVNPYGQEIVDFGFGWFVVEGVDSDGDGRTNGEEIIDDCSMPGDSTSPADTSSWSRIKVLFR